MKKVAEFKVGAVEGFTMATQAVIQYVNTQVALRRSVPGGSTGRPQFAAILQQLYRRAGDGRGPDRILARSGSTGRAGRSRRRQPGGAEALTAAEVDERAEVWRGQYRNRCDHDQNCRPFAGIEGAEGCHQNREATDTVAGLQSMAEAIKGPLDDFFKVIIEGNLSISESFKRWAARLSRRSRGHYEYAGVDGGAGVRRWALTSPRHLTEGVGGSWRTGSGTSDSIPARLSRRVLMTAEAVRRLGLQNLNALTMARADSRRWLVAPGAQSTARHAGGRGHGEPGLGCRTGWCWTTS